MTGKCGGKTGDKSSNKGRCDAPTPPEKSVGGKNDMAVLSGIIDGGDADQADWLAEEATQAAREEALPVSLFEEAAIQSNAKRRARGRPKGSTNRRNADVFAYFEARGYADPLETLMLIQSADTTDLAARLAVDKIEALRLQIAAAKEILPYKYARKPQALHIKQEAAHVFLAGKLDAGSGDKREGKTLSIFGDSQEKT